MPPLCSSKWSTLHTFTGFADKKNRLQISKKHTSCSVLVLNLSNTLRSLFLNDLLNRLFSFTQLLK